jgi:predicted nucleotidyltransferase component of viral defense system
LLPGRAVTEATIRDDLGRVIGRVGEASGIDFTVRAPVLWMRPDGTSLEGRIYCRGPRATPEAASIKIDLSLTEVVVRPPVLRQLSHPFPDGLPAPASVRCYSFEELFAEKLRRWEGVRIADRSTTLDMSATGITGLGVPCAVRAGERAAA